MIIHSRFTIGSLQSDDFQAFFRLQTDLKAREFLGGPVEHSSIADKFKVLLAPLANSFHWAVRDLKSEFIGLLSLAGHEQGTTFELSYQFLPEHWGKGYARESIPLILKLARDRFGLLTVLAETQTKNTRSRRLLEDLGFGAEQFLERFGASQVIYKRFIS